MLYRWQGLGAGTKTAVMDGRNWINEAGTAYVEAAHPGSGAAGVDDLLFDAPLAVGAGAPTTLCDFTAEVKLRSLTIGETFDGDLGASGAYFKAEIDSVRIDAPAAGNIYLTGIGTNGLSGIMQFGGPASTKKVYYDGKLTAPQWFKGIININAGATIVTSALFGYVSSINSDLTGTIAAGATLPAAITQTGGSIVNSNAFTTLNQSGGYWTQLLGDITTINGGAGNVVWTGGNIGSAVMVAGSLDGSGSQISRRIGNVTLFAAASMNLDNGVGNIICTGKVTNYGGAMVWPTGIDLGLIPTITDSVAFIPTTLNSGATASIDGAAVYLGLYDKLEIFCAAGAIAGGSTLKFEVFEDTASDWPSEAEVTAFSTDFADDDDNSLVTLTVWGYNLTAGCNYVRVKATNGAAFDAVASATYRLSTN